MNSPLPVMRGKYCRRSRPLNFAMRCADALLSMCLSLRSRGGTIKPPKRLLISNLAHLGDLVVATSLLPVLKSAFPDCRVGFLIGSWGRPALQGHPLVDEIHILDHWTANRAALTRGQKWRRSWRTRRQALREVRAARYDAALDLCWSFPNTLPFLWQARIPVRIGYASGAGGPLATHCLDFDERPLHAAARHLALVRMLPVQEADLALAAPTLPPVSAADRAVLSRHLQEADVREGEFLIFHVGAGGHLKVWPASKWRLLAKQWREEGWRVVFTGSGEKDEALIGEILEDLTGCVSLCSRLNWGQFVAVIAQTPLLVCVDTVAGHVAGTVGTPCAVIMTGQNPFVWEPLGQRHQAVFHPVPCLPCHRGQGCAGMECIRDLEVEQVYQAGRVLLEESRRGAAGTRKQ